MIEPEYIKIRTEEGINGIIYFEDILDDKYYYNEFKRQAIGRTSKHKYKIGNRVNLTIKGIDDYKMQVLFTLNSKIVTHDKPKTLIKK